MSEKTGRGTGEHSTKAVGKEGGKNGAVYTHRFSS